MSTLRGQRFEIDLDHDGIAPRFEHLNSGSNFIADVLERETTTVNPPTLKSRVTGFPEHKKRTASSRFKLNTSEQSSPQQTASSRFKQKNLSRHPGEGDEKWQIHAENRKAIAHMSPAEIEQERQDLFSGLSPALLEKLLKRSNIDAEPSRGAKGERESKPVKERPSKVERKVSFALPESAPEEERLNSTAERHSISDCPKIPSETTNTDQELPPQTLPDPASITDRELPPQTLPGPASITDRELPPQTLPDPASITDRELPPQTLPGPASITDRELPPQTLPDPASIPVNDGGSIHFPTAPAPDLDPNSDSFLEDLHEKYFPNLAHDPSKLSWMTAATSEENASYAPTQQDLIPADLRFDFKGALIPPSLSNTLPTDLGLHHHGLAPSAAGYTIPELALLARSTYPAQRCIAFQTLGRILYRLGIGEFGDEANLGVQRGPGEKAVLARGLWNAVEDGKVIDLMTEESNKERGHRSSIAMAQEAVWNWTRGGGRRRRAV
ncbi:hypothetical protein E6O75_ATG09479 [Venturia nashicola]|uniref:Uncharacterized protein n=1 Tax=Venturia nashicola TaxID=86259 RepID=A0A4Z1NTW9_9PEZI|nr:hypothetical protein E6O75_ATG09479 [Venturia nashicola]